MSSSICHSGAHAGAGAIDSIRYRREVSDALSSDSLDKAAEETKEKSKAACLSQIDSLNKKIDHLKEKCTLVSTHPTLKDTEEAKATICNMQSQITILEKRKKLLEVALPHIILVAKLHLLNVRIKREIEEIEARPPSKTFSPSTLPIMSLLAKFETLRKSVLESVIQPARESFTPDPSDDDDSTCFKLLYHKMIAIELSHCDAASSGIPKEESSLIPDVTRMGFSCVFDALESLITTIVASKKGVVMEYLLAMPEGLAKDRLRSIYALALHKMGKSIAALEFTNEIKTSAIRTLTIEKIQERKEEMAEEDEAALVASKMEEPTPAESFTTALKRKDFASAELALSNLSSYYSIRVRDKAAAKLAEAYAQEGVFPKATAHIASISCEVKRKELAERFMSIMKENSFYPESAQIQLCYNNPGLYFRYLAANSGVIL